EISTLSLHDALPISSKMKLAASLETTAVFDDTAVSTRLAAGVSTSLMVKLIGALRVLCAVVTSSIGCGAMDGGLLFGSRHWLNRSEEHTSELQSREQ